MIVLSLSLLFYLYQIVYHPNQPGEYGVVFFISGLGGFIPSFIYENHLANVSAHGYIAVSSAFILPFALDNDTVGNLTKGQERNGDKNRVGDRNDEYWNVLKWVRTAACDSRSWNLRQSQYGGDVHNTPK